ncbi:Receptor homology region, transmembrane domain-and RING domain-containing protein 1, partial [Linum grandiflorum]
VGFLFLVTDALVPNSWPSLPELKERQRRRLELGFPAGKSQLRRIEIIIRTPVYLREMKGSFCTCLLLLICFGIPVTSAMVVLKPFFMSFPDLPAKFAAGVTSSGVCGALHVAKPLQACSSLHGRIGFNRTERASFALIVRGGCAFEDKIRNAQLAGFRAAIVFDDRDKRNLVYMMVNPDDVKIHAVFVSKATGEILMEHASGEEAECCIYPSQNDTAWTVLAISFLSLVVVLIFLVIALVTPRHWVHWRRFNFHNRSVDAKTVETLPCFTFHSAHLRQSHCGETCVICLEDYKDGEVLKVLPCKHEFHSSCVCSWLTKWGTFCPVCKLDMRNDFTYSEIKRGIRSQNR